MGWKIWSMHDLQGVLMHRFLVERFAHHDMPCEKLASIYHLAMRAKDYSVGRFVEFGCFEGLTSCFLQSVLGTDWTLVVFDSFQGDDELGPEDTGLHPFYGKGKFQSNEHVVRQNFEVRGIRQPDIVMGNVLSTVPDNLPPSIAFAMLDLDMYTPTMHVLEHIYPRLSKGAIVVIDDYGFNDLPNILKATNRFLLDKPEHVDLLWGGSMSLGYFVKQ